MKVLFIDDDQMIIEAWSLILQKEGFETLYANTGREGIESAKQNQPNFILVDQIMPDMQGNDVLEALKKDPDTSNIPVAMASNYSENEIIQDAIGRGAIDYILKYQIDPSDLAKKIKTLLGEGQTT